MTRLLFLTALVSAAPAALQAVNPACQPMLDAMTKIYSTPVHIYSTVTAGYTGGKTRLSETIYLNHSTYVLVDGKWRTSPITMQAIQDMKKDQQESNANATCRAVREESVNGENSVVYSVHQATSDATIDSQIWISKPRGVPLKTDVQMDVGGKFGKSHRLMRYEYTNVQAPAGIR